VSQAWAGPLYTFFLKRGYTFVYASYGGQHDGYMGVGVAVPLDRYDVAEVYVDRLADTIRWPCGDGKSESGSNSDDTAGDSTGDDARVEVKGSFMGSLSSVDGGEGQSVGVSATSVVEATVNNRHPQRKRKVDRCLPRNEYKEKLIIVSRFWKLMHLEKDRAVYRFACVYYCCLVTRLSMPKCILFPVWF
jgi:hypothetical protein